MEEQKNVFEEENFFRFPFEPYDIQKDFMRKLYETLKDGKIGIFESPTGTGKSLSIICAALKWLTVCEQEKEKEIKAILEGKTKSSPSVVDDSKENEEPSWVNDFVQQKTTNDLLEKTKENELKKKTQKDKLMLIRKRNKLAKRKRDDCPSLSQASDEISEDADVKAQGDDDEDLILQDYNSDDNEDRNTDDSSEVESEQNEEDEALKIFYCSRTHSQLTQFVHEVKKTMYADKIKLVVLASRQNYCINEDINQSKSTSQINEKCLDLQKKKKDKTKPIPLKLLQPKKRRRKIASGCLFYNYKRFLEFRDHVTVEVQDIEQLVSLGKDLDTCPYYGTRHTIPQAQLVVLPYQTLLHKSTRESVGISIKGSVVIIDEAHNLIETINNIHSVHVSQTQISSSVNELQQYKDRYSNRLHATNMMFIDQILYVLNSLLTAFQGTIDASCPGHTLSTINDFMFTTKIDNINLFKLRKYCEKSHIAKKLNGFVERYRHSDPTSEITNVISSQFLFVDAFLCAMTNADKDGRILITKEKLPSKSSLKFLMLNPAVHFMEILNECKSLIVAGGTMQPVAEFKDVLLRAAGVDERRIVEFSCGHVIPAANLAVVALSKGPSTVDLNFTFQNRNNTGLIEELGRILCNICCVVPGGVVCFFPSYDYEEFVCKHWKKTGVYEKLAVKKSIFEEPKKSHLCDRVLADYTNKIKRCRSGLGNGALLLSVVGGKMSEGINFSDDLGRCIIMIGLPYPNINSPELKEKMRFLDRTIGPKAGQEHYENICMKAVNQSIGRSIRHKDDYASIVLLDERFARSSVQNKLPTWIKSQLQLHSRFGPALGSLSKFFAARRT